MNGGAVTGGRGAAALRRVGVIAGLSLLRTSRDRIALFFTFLLPLMIVVLLSATVQGGELVVGVAAHDDAAFARGLVADLDGSDAVKVRRYASDAALERAVRLQHVQGGVVVPAGYDDALRSGAPATVRLVVNPSSRDASAIRTQVHAVVAAQTAAVQAARLAVSTGGASFENALAVAVSLSGGDGLGVDSTTSGERGLAGLDARAYATVGEVVLFLFLIALTSAGDLVQARRDGTARRVLAAPTTPGLIVAGEGLARYLIALVQGGFILGVGSLLLGLSFGDPLGVALLLLTFALVATSVGLLVGTLARSNEQATALGPPIGIALAMLGGAMWPLEIVSAAMRAVGHLTPHAWALDGFIDLMGNGAGAAAILPQVAALLAFSAVLLPLASFRLRHALGA